MVLTPKHERWAQALAVMKQHGAGLHLHIAQRIGALAVTGDAVGVQRWKEIAACVDKIVGGTRH